MNILKRIINRIFSDVKISFDLGFGIFSKIKLFLVIFWITFKKVIGLRDRVDVKLHLKKFGENFYFHLTDSSDLNSLREIFVKNEYNFFIKNKPDVIFDLGSNVGLSVIYFKLKYPRAKIYAFEPDSNTFKKLLANTKQFRDVFCYNLAVSDRNGSENFYINSNSSMSSSLIKRAGSMQCVEVKIRSLDSLIEDIKISKIDLLKFDIEGAELDVFKNFNKLFKIKELIGEVHLDLIDGTKQEFLNLFQNFDLKINQHSSKRFIIKAIKNE